VPSVKPTHAQRGSLNVEKLIAFLLQKKIQLQNSGSQIGIFLPPQENAKISMLSGKFFLSLPGVANRRMLRAKSLKLEKRNALRTVRLSNPGKVQNVPRFCAALRYNR